MRFLTLLLCTLCFIACEESDDPEIYENKLIGYWNQPIQSDSIIEYNRTTCLKENEFGFQFLDDGSMYERKNAGWCSTPPISCTDYRGTWTQKDSILKITVGYWGGQIDYRWSLILLDNDQLKIKVLSSEFH